MATNGKECKNPGKTLVAAIFEKAKTYIFAEPFVLTPTARFLFLQPSLQPVAKLRRCILSNRRIATNHTNHA